MTPEGPRRQYIAGNWKMHKTAAEAREYVQRLLSRLPMGNGVELALCVPFTALGATVEALGGSDVKVLAQNMHQEASGAYTGEGSAPMILELGVNGVLLGHWSGASTSTRPIARFRRRCRRPWRRGSSRCSA